MDDNNALLLRPEAQPYNIDSLSQSQRKALLAILKKIKQTSDAVSGSSRKEEQNGSLPKRAIPVQPKSRTGMFFFPEVGEAEKLRYF